MKKCQHKAKQCINVKLDNGLVISYDVYCLQCQTILYQVDVNKDRRKENGAKEKSRSKRKNKYS